MLNSANSWNYCKQFSPLLCVVTHIWLRLVFSMGKNAEVCDCNWKVKGDVLHLSLQLKVKLWNNLNILTGRKALSWLSEKSGSFTGFNITYPLAWITCIPSMKRNQPKTPKTNQTKYPQQSSKVLLGPLKENNTYDEISSLCLLIYDRLLMLMVLS